MAVVVYEARQQCVSRYRIRALSVMEEGVLQIARERVAPRLHHAAEAWEIVRKAARSKTRSDCLHLRKSRTLSGHLQAFTARERLCVSRRASLAEAVRGNTPRLCGEHANARHARNALIAIVDDDQWAREGMNIFVGSLGYLGATFMSAEDYLGSDLKQRAGCLILDVHLGGMSGPDLQDRLLADGYRTPIIFVSAHFDDRVRDRVIAAGAFGYFAKPCNERVLTSCLERAVGS